MLFPHLTSSLKLLPANSDCSNEANDCGLGCAEIYTTVICVSRDLLSDYVTE